MSSLDQNLNSFISLLDSADNIVLKFKRAITDIFDMMIKKAWNK